jgi:hypothetical protein
MTARAANGRATRLSAAVDSAQTPEARAARIAGITASRVARDQWEASHTVTNEERAEFTETVIPGLSMIPLQTIAEAIGVSIASASLIRRRVMAPHARHWATLSLLVASRHDD